MIDSRPVYPPEYDTDAPDNCAECGTPIDIETQEYFCSAQCERNHVAAMRAADDAYAKALAEADKFGAQWQAMKAQLREEVCNGR